MDFNKIIKRAIGLITKSNEEWDKIQNESLSLKNLYINYAIIVYAIPSVALLFGMIIMGAPIGMSLIMSIIFYILTIGIIYLIGILIDVIGKQFGGTKDMLGSQKLAVFSLTPFGLIGALFILPIGGSGYVPGIFYLIILISLYSFYLMYLGASKIKNIAKDKLVPFIVIIAVIWVVLIYIDFRISSRIALEAFIGSLRFRGGF